MSGYVILCHVRSDYVRLGQEGRLVQVNYVNTS
jgi:hypothetical protein